MPPPPDAGGPYRGQQGFYETVTAAINDVTEYGFDSQARIDMWIERIRTAAVQAAVSPQKLEEALNQTLRSIYHRMVERGGILQIHKGAPAFTIDRVKPKLRAELDRRIMASAGLIRLNQTQAIEKTVQRFAGWASSIPAGGSDAVDRVEVKTDIRKSIAALPFEERRVLIDQGHKFNAALSNILAVDGGALALVWRSHWRRPGYNYRPDHKERDGKIFVLRGNWALDKGLMKRGPAQYYDEVTAVGEEVFCSCNGVYLYSLRDLPADMLTQKGAESLARARKEMAA